MKKKIKSKKIKSGESCFYNRTCFIVTTPKYLYWLFLRDSDNWKDKGKWCLKTMKSDNNGTCCG